MWYKIKKLGWKCGLKLTFKLKIGEIIESYWDHSIIQTQGSRRIAAARINVYRVDIIKKS